MVRIKALLLFLFLFLFLTVSERHYYQMYYQTQFQEISRYAAYRSIVLEEDKDYVYFQMESLKKRFYKEWERRKLQEPSAMSIVYFLSDTGGICENQCDGVQIGIQLHIHYWQFIYRVNYHISKKGERK